MKNKHIISTDKPSRLGRFIDTNNLFLRVPNDIPRGINVNIYITSDEKIKEGDWFLLDMSHSSHPNEVHQMGHNKWSKTGGINFSEPNSWTKACKKIILTTDPDLIKDGVQAIDDEFLVWFVKNPSCETIDIDSIPNSNWGFDLEEPMNLGYKIIIPKEEPKKEVTGVDDNRPKPNYCYAKEQGHGEIGCVFPSCHCGLPVKQEEPKQIKCYCGHTITCDCEPLQETIEEFINQSNTPEGLDQFSYDKGLEDGVKWQQEQDKNKYSEEEVRQMFNRYNEIIAHRDIEEWQPWIEKQFKKKFG